MGCGRCVPTTGHGASLVACRRIERLSLFSAEDEHAIEATIASVESRTAAELVVLVVPRSDEHVLGRALLAGLGAVAFMTALDWAWPWIARGMPSLADALPLDPLTWLLPLQALVAAGLWWLGGRLPARWLASEARLSEAVERRAKQAFFDRRVSHTRDRSGVLVLVSEQERRVQILADRGVDERLGQSAWTRWVEAVVTGMSVGEGASALCTVLEQMGDVLAEHFPARDDDEDELPNQLAREP